jgi:hypothetical protein
MKPCPTPTDLCHTADVTAWFHLAYGTPLPLWRVIPHDWVTRECPRVRPYAEGWRAGIDFMREDQAEETR